MTLLADMAERAGRVGYCPPWTHLEIDAETWRMAIANLAVGAWDLLGLWGEHRAVHMAVLEGTQTFAVLTLPCPDGIFPSLARSHPPASRPERAIRDLFGLEAADTPDLRPWLDHGDWGVRHPLAGAGAGAVAARTGEPYPFLPAEGESLHRIAVGPVHAGIIEPGFFLFTANGETIVRLEERLGYVHKGIEALMAGAELVQAAQLAGRVSGDSTVAYAFAFARAVEAALEIEVPPRAVYLRALMAELERIANHLGDFGAICNDASFALMHAQCGMLRERVLRVSQECFGHRMMRDCIVPGGVASDLFADGPARLRGLIENCRKRLRDLYALYDSTASLLDRTVGTGILQPELARQYAAGGYVGRASGRNFDARKAIGYAPYHDLHFEVPVLQEGDVNARVLIRVREIEQSLSLVEQILTALPGGAVRNDFAALGASAREGVGFVEGFRGDILVWLRVGADGRIERCHLRDPSWFQWPLLEAAIEGNIVADFPLCNKSFNCSYSGHDL